MGFAILGKHLLYAPIPRKHKQSDSPQKKKIFIFYKPIHWNMHAYVWNTRYHSNDLLSKRSRGNILRSLNISFKPPAKRRIQVENGYQKLFSKIKKAPPPTKKKIRSVPTEYAYDFRRSSLRTVFNCSLSDSFSRTSCRFLDSTLSSRMAIRSTNPITCRRVVSLASLKASSTAATCSITLAAVERERNTTV